MENFLKNIKFQKVFLFSLLLLFIFVKDVYALAIRHNVVNNNLKQCGYYHELLDENSIYILPKGWEDKGPSISEPSFKKECALLGFSYLEKPIKTKKIPLLLFWVFGIFLLLLISFLLIKKQKKYKISTKLHLKK